MYQKGKNLMKKDNPLDLSEFTVLMPEKKRSELTLNVRENGEIHLNAALLRQLPERKAEIRISNDFRRILLVPEGEQVHSFAKSGKTKNTQLALQLKKLRISFPVVYKFCWDEANHVFLGELQISRAK